MHVSGWAQATAAVAAVNGTIDVHFAMPPNGDASQIDTDARKVSLNGWPLATADTSIVALEVGSDHFLRVTNRTATPWPVRSVIAAECDFRVDFNDDPASFNPYDWNELLKIQRVQLVALEARVAALEGP